MQTQIYNRIILISLLLAFFSSCSTDNVIFETHQEVEDVVTKNVNKSTWTGSVFSYEKDLWVRLDEKKGMSYDFRIGSGGVISDMRNRSRSFKNLISPSYQGERTDRVIQWTLWSLTGDIKFENPDLANWEQRYNVTQAGTSKDQLHKIMSINVNKAKNRIDIYSKPQLQWLAPNQGKMTGTHSAFTRYSIDDRGFLKVHRVISVGKPKVLGKPKEWQDLYLEAWTPLMGNDDIFNGLALSLDNNGKPNWWYKFGYNIPYYPSFDVKKTYGYAVAYNIANTTAKDAVAIVYGTKDVGVTQGKAKHILNTMSWDTGIGILSAIESKSNIPAYSILEQVIYIVPRGGLSKEMKVELEALAKEIPKPKIHFPNAIPARLKNIYKTLMKNNSLSGGTATDNLNSVTIWE